MWEHFRVPMHLLRFRTVILFKHGNTFVYSIHVWLFKRDIHVLWIIPHPTIFILCPSTHLSYSVVELKSGIITRMFDIIPHYPDASASIALVSTLSVNSFSNIIWYTSPSPTTSILPPIFLSILYLSLSFFLFPAHPPNCQDDYLHLVNNVSSVNLLIF